MLTNAPGAANELSSVVVVHKVSGWLSVGRLHRGGFSRRNSYIYPLPRSRVRVCAVEQRIQIKARVGPRPLGAFLLGTVNVADLKRNLLGLVMIGWTTSGVERLWVDCHARPKHRDVVWSRGLAFCNLF